MQSSSRQVQSSQRGVHPGLPALLRRHQRQPWQKPPQSVDQPALNTLDAALETHRGSVVLDSFCGTGHSTAILCGRYPDALVIGVDKSSHRLDRHPELPENGLLLQAHCEAVWRHLRERRTRLLAHTILYPNPWPKPGHLGRRIHGHPAFTELLALGGHLELRSNWRLYVEEFGVALTLLGHPSRVAISSTEGAALTLFEEKYRKSGHELWSLSADLVSSQDEAVV
ncbi:tRNA (guanine(46)-N(7))-methyltransferase TrmB [Congregibacter litoralis]|uniref:tRNA (guanine(46)-N(7))-methyltransferase n=1 Tax=Congregibacter litoralis KT71 TaxID=314285 RepID=A4A8J0_9GAMM|nr:methyltransferase [Congregibacter litoralis]EAQ97382.1 putative S-adenosylmethionine-dependent methyltransferase [Congregibacter litoralis KT71]